MRNRTTTTDTDQAKESAWSAEQGTIAAIEDMSEEEVQAHIHALLAGKITTDNQQEERQ